MAAGDAGAPTISACLIVRDEAARLPEALDTVTFCDEIVVVDTGSQDGTQEIARSAGARVLEVPWRGYAAARNQAIEQASGDWILEIDADQRLPPAVQEEIRRFVRAPGQFELAAFPIRERFLGREVMAAGRYPNYRHQLFRRGAYVHDERRLVHEGLTARGPVFPFSGDIEHIRAETLAEALSDARRYALLQARQTRLRRSARNAVRIVVRPAARFLYRTVIGGSWRDGGAGLLLVTIECAADGAADALAWIRGTPEHMAGPPPLARRTDGGIPHLVVLASAHSLIRHQPRLDELASHTELVLVTDAPAGVVGARRRRVPRFGLIPVLRALEAEHQLREIDRTIGIGPWAQLLLACAPRRYRPEHRTSPR